MNTSDQIGPDILKALGVNIENCVRATITLAVDRDVEVLAEYRVPITVNEGRAPVFALVTRNLVVRDISKPETRLEGYLPQ